MQGTLSGERHMGRSPIMTARMEMLAELHILVDCQCLIIRSPRKPA